MTDEDFLLEIKEYAKKLNANKKSAEDEDSTISEDNELEIDYLHQVIASLKEQLNAEKEKVKSLNEIISNNNKVIESLNKNYYKEKAEESKNNPKVDTGI